MLFRKKKPIWDAQDVVYRFFFFCRSACARTEPAKLLIPFGEFRLRSSPDTLLAAVKIRQRSTNLSFHIRFFWHSFISKVVATTGLFLSWSSASAILKGSAGCGRQRKKPRNNRWTASIAGVYIMPQNQKKGSFKFRKVE
jgi:hypothetical protein